MAPIISHDLQYSYFLAYTNAILSSFTWQKKAHSKLKLCEKIKKALGDSGDLCESDVAQKNLNVLPEQASACETWRQPSVCRTASIERSLAGISTVMQQIFCPEWKQISGG